MPIFSSENKVTEALWKLLRSSSASRVCFLKLIVGGKVPRPFTGEFELHFRSKTDRGQEIDLLLVNGADAVIVEAKVGDSQKVYQLESYRDFWIRTQGKTPRLIWLVRQPQQLIGMRELGAKTITWKQLHEALRGVAESVEPKERKAIKAFCSGLEASDTLPAVGARTEVTKRYPGYDPEHAWRILDAIGKSVDGFRHRPVQMNELNLALHGGLEDWASEVGDTWKARIIFYFKPEGRQHLVRSSYFFHGQVLLYHQHTARTPGPQDPAVSRWMRELHRSGLEIWRNRPPGWRGRVPVDVAALLRCPMRYLYAEEPEVQARKRFPFDWHSDDAAIQAGSRQLSRLVALASRMWSP
jgi:hypothetical protein